MAVQSRTKSGDRRQTFVSRILRLCAAAIVMVVAVGCSVSAETNPPASAGTLPEAAAMLTAAGETLGLAAALSPCVDRPDRCYQLTTDGTNDLSAMVSVAGDGQATLLDDYEAQGMLRGLYHGREAIIVRPGDRLCPRHDDQSAPTCTHASGGLIAWRHGPYVLSAQDYTATGRESVLAEALWRAAEGALGAFPATMVILADTADTPGANSLRYYRTVAQSVDRYYALNAYGRVDLAFTFMDVDGEAGDEDWYTSDSTLDSYTGRENSYAEAAVRAALAGADLPERVYGERIIVVCPATPSPLGDTRNLFSAAHMKTPTYSIEVQGAHHATRVHVHSLVVVSEEDKVGSWVHEIGHTLYARRRTAGGHHRIADRYGADQGQVGPWDLMSTGSRWGYPEGALPTQMSSFTKEAAGWLHYVPAEWGQTYNLTALENQRIGDGILALDDPAGSDPCSFYIIEGRDGQVFYGAPESGVLIYHVTINKATGQPRVDLLAPQAGEAMGRQSNVAYERPTLHGAVDPAGAREYFDAAAGLRVTLVAESSTPYQAIVRIEKI